MSKAGKQNEQAQVNKFGEVPFEPYEHILDMSDQEARRQLVTSLLTVSKILVNGQEECR